MKKISLVRAAIFTSLITIPFFAFAQTATNVAVGIGTFAGLVDALTGTIIKSLATLLLSIALLVFFYGIVEYIWAKRKGDATGAKTGNQFMTWGLVALFVMFSVYGIIKLAQNTLFGGIDVTTIRIPDINFKSGTSNNVLIGSPASPGNATGVVTPAASNGNYISPTVSGGGLGEGVACVDTQQCASGLTCSGNNASNRACISNGTSNSSADYGCGPGNGYPDAMGSCGSTTVNNSPQSANDGNAGECVYNGNCQTSDGTPGLYDSSCVCQLQGGDL